MNATPRICLTLACACLAYFTVCSPASATDRLVLKPASFAPHVERFNEMDAESVTTFVSNADSWAWLQNNIPLFECPDRDVEEIYYFRWWSFRKHLRQTPKGFVITEFLTPVNHAGEFNTVSCAASMHLAEGRWLSDDRYLNDYTKFWLRGAKGKPQPHFHRYSGWFAAAVWDRYLVSADKKFATSLLPDLVADYRTWEKERQLPSGLFWQYDVWDGMEESISGSRTNENARPTINSYMFANARAIANIARLGNKPKVAAEFDAKAAKLRQLTQEKLWDDNAKFFKVRLEDGGLSEVREAIGFIPWMFDLPEVNPKFESAWPQVSDRQGFCAPFGLTTAERRHPDFRSHGIGSCEWDGAVWPFATSQTLTALVKYLRRSDALPALRRTYHDAFLTYTRSQRAQGKPYIGEYLDEITGDWINRNERSRYYNHSTYADLLITGVVGLIPRADDVVEVSPLLPADTWDWFCLDGVEYHGRSLTIIWDQDGSRYQRGVGLTVFADGKQIAHSERLTRVTGNLPKSKL